MKNTGDNLPNFTYLRNPLCGGLELMSLMIHFIKWDQMFLTGLQQGDINNLQPTLTLPLVTFK